MQRWRGTSFPLTLDVTMFRVDTPQNGGNESPSVDDGEPGSWHDWRAWLMSGKQYGNRGASWCGVRIKVTLIMSSCSETSKKSGGFGESELGDLECAIQHRFSSARNLSHQSRRNDSPEKASLAQPWASSSEFKASNSFFRASSINRSMALARFSHVSCQKKPWLGCKYEGLVLWLPTIFCRRHLCRG